jgi:hypothetical protein
MTDGACLDPSPPDSLVPLNRKMTRGIYVPEGMDRDMLIGLSNVIRERAGIDCYLSNSTARAVVAWLQEQHIISRSTP